MSKDVILGRGRDTIEWDYFQKVVRWLHVRGHPLDDHSSNETAIIRKARCMGQMRQDWRRPHSRTSLDVH